MSLDVNCPQCGSELTVADAAAGKTARCPDCGAAVAVPADEAISRTPAPAKETAPPPDGPRPVAAASLLAPARNWPARFGSTFALLSLVPGLALLFGPLALLLGLVGLVVGRFKGVARGTRDVVAALGLGLLTSAGNWGLVLYVWSVLGVPEPVAEAFHIRPTRPHPGPPFPNFGDPFGDEEKPDPARKKSLTVANHLIFEAAFSLDGKRVVVFSGLQVDLCELDTERHRTIDAERAEVLVFSPDGKWLAVSSGKNPLEVRLFDTQTGQCQKTLAVGGFAFPWASMIAFSADGSLLAAGSTEGVRLWRTDGWEELTTGIQRGYLDPSSLALSPDGSTLAVGGHEAAAGGNTILLWDTRQGKKQGRLAAKDDHPDRLVFSPDGKRLAAMGMGKIKVWDVGEGNAAWTTRGDPFSKPMEFSPDGRLLVSCDPDDSLALSDAATGKRLGAVGRVRHRDQRFLAARFTPDGGTLLTASDQGIVETWDVAELLKQGPGR